MYNLASKAYDLRINVLDLIYKAKTGHIGGDFSMMDILVCLYYSVMNISPQNYSDANRDRFILSKGHSVESLYSVLADRGFFSKQELFDTYSALGSKFIGHPNNKVKGIEMNTGSLGHGLPLAVGMALAAKLDEKSYRVYTVAGDGEMAEGSVWEAMMAASHYNLDNITLFIDKNGLQISGPTEEVMNSESLAEKIKSFGWDVAEIDGHDMTQICAVAETSRKSTKPYAVIAKTVKGKGVSFMENNYLWHHKVPSKDEYEAARNELVEKREALK